VNKFVECTILARRQLNLFTNHQCDFKLACWCLSVHFSNTILYTQSYNKSYDGVLMRSSCVKHLCLQLAGEMSHSQWRVLEFWW